MQFGMTSDERAVGQGAIVADDPIMADMRSDHQQIPVADAGPTATRRSSPVDRDVLAEDVSVADLKRRVFAAIRAVLRTLAQNRAVADEIIATHNERTRQAGMSFNDRPRTDLDRSFDDRIGANLNVGSEFSFGGDDGGGVD